MAFLVLVMLLLTQATTGLPSTQVFDSKATEQWINGVCSDNSTCRGTADMCYSQFKRARAILTTMSAQRVTFTLTRRCQQQRQIFDTCAKEAQLNATWTSITGFDLTCGSVFLRGRTPIGFSPKSSFGPMLISGKPHRIRRNAPDQFGIGNIIRIARKQQLSHRPTESEIDFNGLENSNSELSRRRDYERIMRNLLLGRRRWKRAESPISRVTKFMEGVENTNPQAIQNYTICVLREEGLAHPNGTLNRAQFMGWARVAFVWQTQVSDAVTTAMQDCDEPEEAQLSEYMQCWGRECVDNWTA